MKYNDLNRASEVLVKRYSSHVAGFNCACVDTDLSFTNLCLSLPLHGKVEMFGEIIGKNLSDNDYLIPEDIETKEGIERVITRAIGQPLPQNRLLLLHPDLWMFGLGLLYWYPVILTYLRRYNYDI